MIRCIFFDLDGTLIEFNLDVQGSRYEIFKAINSLVPSLEGLNEKYSTFSMLEKVRVSVDESKYKEVRSLVYSICDAFEERATEQTKLRDDAINVLDFLRDSNRRIALFTNSGRKAVNKILNRFDLRKYFDLVVTRDDVELMKPSPKGIYLLLKALDSDPLECVMVGDGVIDIIPAKDAGVRVIVVSGGFNPISRLLEEKPDYVISTLKDLPKLIYSL